MLIAGKFRCNSMNVLYGKQLHGDERLNPVESSLLFQRRKRGSRAALRCHRHGGRSRAFDRVLHDGITLQTFSAAKLMMPPVRKKAVSKRHKKTEAFREQSIDSTPGAGGAGKAAFHASRGSLQAGGRADPRAIRACSILQNSLQHTACSTLLAARCLQHAACSTLLAARCLQHAACSTVPKSVNRTAQLSCCTAMRRLSAGEGSTYEAACSRRD